MFQFTGFLQASSRGPPATSQGGAMNSEAAVEVDNEWPEAPMIEQLQSMESQDPLHKQYHLTRTVAPTQPPPPASAHHDFVDGQVCALFGCYKVYDAAEQAFNGFCSQDCEEFYKEILQGRTPDCASPGCGEFAEPPHVPFCSKECSIEYTMHADSDSAHIAEKQQTSQQSFDSHPSIQGDQRGEIHHAVAEGEQGFHHIAEIPEIHTESDQY